MRNAETAVLAPSASRIPTQESVPCTPSDIEDRAPPALRADQPLAPARVAKPERPAADGARRQRHVAARAVGGVMRGVRLADRELLFGGVLGVIGHAPDAPGSPPESAPSRPARSRTSPARYSLPPPAGRPARRAGDNARPRPSSAPPSSRSRSP